MGIHAACKGHCKLEHPNARKRFLPQFGITHENGYKTCAECEICIKTDDVYCSCCGIKYRNRPRFSRIEKKMLVRI